MPKCRNKKSAEGAAFELHELTSGSHVEENKKSYVVKVGSKVVKRFTFEEEPHDSNNV